MRKDKDRILIPDEGHIFDDYPERGHSMAEVIKLICNKSGILEDTTINEYRGSRFYRRTEDSSNLRIRFVIEFDEDEQGKLILVISAGERI